ncbi:MAG: Ig-like domain repeat protein [Terracidiphilus sp.]
MKKILFAFISLLLIAPPMFAAAPTCMYQDVLSGPATGGEGGNGIYLTIFGKNFESTRGTSTVTVNGKPVAQYLVWGSSNDVTGDHDQISVQIASGTTGTGPVVVTTPGGSCSNLSFTVRPGHIYFIGPTVDNSKPASCSTMIGSNSFSTPWGLTNYASTTEANYSFSTMRTPYTYYHCMSPGDTLVFLNGASYPYFDGRGWHASLSPDNTSVTATSFMTIMARPGASVQLGGSGWAIGIRPTGTSSYTVFSGLKVEGNGTGNLAAFAMENNARVVGNTITCPDCYGQSGALTGAYPNSNNLEILGNAITNVSTNTTVLPNGSNKEFHDVYVAGNDIEFAWNRIYNTQAYNGLQINHDGSTGFYNQSYHDNDIADVNGSGFNLSTIDPSSGYIQVYNNIIHHTGVNTASDGDADDPHNCIAVKGYYGSAGTGTADIYNNTMYDCSSNLNVNPADQSSCAVLVKANTWNSITTNLVNNIVYQPTYAGTAKMNVYMCVVYYDGTTAKYSGSNNIWYSASTPGSSAYATTIGTVENPLFVSATDGAWTNYELQSTSPAQGAGIAVDEVYANSTTYANLTWDFNYIVRPSPLSIGALEYGSTSSGTQVTVSASPNSATLEQPVTLTATVAQTGGSAPSGSINFLSAGISLGQASLDSEGTATLVVSWQSVGSYEVTAVYSGDSNYPSGESNGISLQVTSATTTSLVASSNQVTAGQALGLTATVEGSGSTAPTGSVSFLKGSTVLGTATLNSSGVATLSTTSLATGANSLTAQYTGSTSYGSSKSAVVVVTVVAAAQTSQSTTTILVASSNQVTAGHALGLTATVEGSGSTAPTGSVSFLKGSTVLGTATLNSSGVATLSTTSLATGSNSLTAQYKGSTSYGSSKSAVVVVTVVAAAQTSQSTVTSLVAYENKITSGQSLTLKATVKGSGSATPTGTVSFHSGSTLLGTATLNSSGVATIATKALATGTDSVTVKYSGSASYLSSTSAAVSVTVKP